MWEDPDRSMESSRSITKRCPTSVLVFHHTMPGMDDDAGDEDRITGHVPRSPPRRAAPAREAAASWVRMIVALPWAAIRRARRLSRQGVDAVPTA